MQVHFALLISTTCQRFSLGFFILSVISSNILGISLPMDVISIIALVFLVIGALASAAHLGRPSRFFNSFSNPGSHLSQEAIISPFLGVALFLCCIDTLFLHSGTLGAVFQWVSVALSALFLVSTGLVYQLYARPAWDTPLVLIIFLLSSAEIGTLSVLSAAEGGPDASLIIMASLALAACVISQYLYLQRLPGLGSGTAIKVSAAPYRALFVIWLLVGVLAPALALLGLSITEQAIYAFLGAGASIIGIMVWTAFFFKSALKVKLFPMYRVDVNEYM